MVNVTFKGNDDSYTTLREIGRGGEGQVYEIVNKPTLVLKLYADSLSPERIVKLRLMVSLATPPIDLYTAWPKDIVVNKQGQVCGFVMKKLTKYVPIHNLFSPMDRKRLFPDKGYNFLVHVARNLSVAFHSLHAEGIIVGDVNEGNILVNGQGMIAFIDCDSFQIKNGNTYHFCEVGVPRYTAPELLAITSFENVIRTSNTDTFSMAVILFQLLFLGRHPFAGKHNSTDDIDEEKAIKKHWFAYSLNNKHQKLLPPNDSLPLKTVSSALQDLFHESFEQIERRPLPAKWVTALDDFQKTMVLCTASPLHNYPNTFDQCPWCAFKEKRNILYFLDDSYLQHFPAEKDFDEFINGFKVKKLTFPKLELNDKSLKFLKPNPVNPQFKKDFIKQGNVLIFLLVIGMLSWFQIRWKSLFTLPAVFVLDYFLPWRKRLIKELDLREKNLNLFQDNLNKAIENYQKPPEMRNYEKAIQKINQLIKRYQNMPKELLERQKAMEQKVYDEQFRSFLAGFRISDYEFPGMGASRMASFYAAGIYTAADIDRLKTTKLVGIGPKFIQMFLSWQRNMGSGFVYHPDNDLLLKEYRGIVVTMNQEKQQLEATIKSTFQSIRYMETSIKTKQSQLQHTITTLQRQYVQAELDLKELKLLLTLSKMKK